MLKNSIEFPQNCIRGIVTAKHIIDETGGVAPDLFIPNTKTAEFREDNGEEVSINWEDNETVLKFILTSKNEHGHYLFPNGAVRLDYKYIDRINKLPTMENPLSYERCATDDNPYHGNLVYRQGLTPRIKRMIAGNLALSSSPVIMLEDI